jgi:glycosyltransferase involved in cell wall biosynthesis
VQIKPLFYEKVLPTSKILTIIDEEVRRADIIMVRLPSLLGLYTAFCAIKNKKEFTVEVVGSAWGSYWYKSLSGKIMALPLELLSKYIIKRAAYVLYVTDKYLQKEYPTNGTTVGCSDVVLEGRSMSVLSQRLSALQENKRNKLILGTLAQIDYKYKGHDTVIKAIAQLKSKGLSFEYRLAGSGSQEYIKKIAIQYGVLENISFFGQINHSEINSWLDSLDVYVQPSLTEGLPRAVIEALYRALPVVVSNAGGMYELVEPFCTYRKGKVNELVQILQNIDNEKKQEMSRRNFYFSEKFNYEKLQETRRSFYEQIRDDNTL